MASSENVQARHHNQKAGPAEDAEQLWLREYRASAITPDALRERLHLNPHLKPGKAHFPLRVTESYLSKINPGDPRDPLLLQIWPTSQEDHSPSGFVADPLQELDQSQPGLIRKYPGRALLIATGACPIHCRYCFRQHFPYAETIGKNRLRRQIEAIRQDPSLSEIILSGGDPLSLLTPNLLSLLQEIDVIEHVATIRLHTRMPVVLPSRMTPQLLSGLAQLRSHLVVVIHVNHPRELDASTESALQQLRETATLLNQSVLLRGINDSPACLADLSRKLLHQHVLPYYLHQLDPVAGAAHFEVSDKRARALLAELRDQLPGYLVPRLVREIPGRGSKTVLS